jgi:hypothetical protein
MINVLYCARRLLLLKGLVMNSLDWDVSPATFARRFTTRSCQNRIDVTIRVVDDFAGKDGG